MWLKQYILTAKKHFFIITFKKYYWKKVNFLDFVLREREAEVYLSCGGSLRERDDGVSAGPVEGPFLGSVGACGWVTWTEEMEDSRGFWDIERAFFSPTGSPHMAGSLTADPSSPALGPWLGNHSPDLVSISCCLRHLLHTHITWGKRNIIFQI